MCEKAIFYLYQALLLKAQNGAARDHQMVVQCNVKALRQIAQLMGHFNIGARRRRVARGVIMGNDEGGGVQFQRPFDDLAWIDRRMVDRASAHLFIGDDIVLFIQKNNMKFFDFVFRHFGAAISEQCIPIGQCLFIDDGCLPYV